MKDLMFTLAVIAGFGAAIMTVLAFGGVLPIWVVLAIGWVALVATVGWLDHERRKRARALVRLERRLSAITKERFDAIGRRAIDSIRRRQPL